MYAAIKIRMQNSLRNAFDFVKPKNKLGIISFCLIAVLALAIFLVLARPAAAESLAEGLGKALLGVATDIVFWVARFFFKIAIWALQFIIEIAGYNGYLDSTAVQIGWVLVRDVANMFFVVILMIIAFGTVLGLEQYEWKKMMVKFVLAAILVNFSRIICGVIIDVAQVVMITFVNGVAAVAAGNMVNAFNVEEAFKFAENTKPGELNTVEGFGMAVGALMFASITMAIMFVFLFILAARMLTLWVLIILSPLAFVLSVVPQTSKYATQWWSEFGNHVVVGPAIVFFLWLAFAVVGGGTIENEIRQDSQVQDSAKVKTDEQATLAIGASFVKISNFFIAVGILMVGAKTAQSLGVQGGSMMQGAVDFGKKVATIASGYTAGRWIAGKGVQGAKAAGKWAGMNIPIVGGKAWVRRGKAIAGTVGYGWQRFGQWRDKGAQALEATSKKLRMLDIQKKEGKISEEDYQKEKKEITGAGVTRALKMVGRGFKGLVAGKIESEVRSEKRAENFIKAAEAQKKITEADTSTSSLFGGQLKIEATAKLEDAEKRQKAKAEQKMAGRITSFYARDNKIIQEAQANYDQAIQAAEEAKTPEEKQAAEARKAEAARRLEKAKKGITAGTTAAEVAARTATAQRKIEEGRGQILAKRGEKGEEMFTAEAAAKEVTEGMESYESTEMTRRRSAGLAADAQAFAAVEEEATAEARQLEEVQESIGQVLPSLNDKIKEVVADIQGGSIGEENAAKQAFAKLYQDLPEHLKQQVDQKRIEFNGGRDYADDDPNKALQSGEAFRQLFVHQEGENWKSDKLQTDSAVAAENKSADADKMIDVLRKIEKAISEGKNVTEAKVALGEAGIDNQALQSLQVLCGNKKFDDIYKDKQSVGVLKQILATEKRALVGKKNGAAAEHIRQTLAQQAGDAFFQAKAKMRDVRRQAIFNAPAMFAAQSRATYDHEYGLYRGRQRDTVDKAAQQMIWDDYGIHAPTFAGQESVIEEIWTKRLKGMNYDMSVKALDGNAKAAMRKRMEFEKAKPGEKYVPSEEEKMVTQAILYQLFSQSWVDDGGLPVDAVKIRQAIQKVKDSSGLDVNDSSIAAIQTKVERRRPKTAVPKFNPTQITDVADLLKGTVGQAVDLNNIITILRQRGPDEPQIKEFVRNFGRAINTAISQKPAMRDVGIENIENLLDKLHAGHLDEVQQIIGKAKPTP